MESVIPLILPFKASFKAVEEDCLRLLIEYDCYLHLHLAALEDIELLCS